MSARTDRIRYRKKVAALMTALAGVDDWLKNTDRKEKRKAFWEPNLKKDDKWIPGRQL